RHGVALFTAALLTFIVLLRHHLRDLAEVAETYSTFYPYLERHPEALYRYAKPAHEDQSQRDQQQNYVPPILHHIFLTEGRNWSSLFKYESAIASCQDLHPNWTHHLWTDAMATTFMNQHYPEIFPHYKGYKQSIQRVNVLRYALLHHFGGVYLDIDVTYLQPLDDLRTLPWLTPGAYPAGVNNAFILAKPDHRLLEHLLAKVKSRDLLWGMPYVENMLSTGCMFFSNRWMNYARSLARTQPVPMEDRIYILADQEGNMDPHMLRGAVTTPLFSHAGASSLHGWDAAAIVLLGKHYGYF
ncbi:hypothetical protein NA57DRAFT_9908, partial [Rhizodiscina lignyota]